MKKQEKKIEIMDHTEVMSPKKSKKPNQPTTNTEDSKLGFTCDVCNVTFTEKHHIVRHCRIHTGEKPFMCKVCCKSFRDQSNFQSHLITHSKEKRFQCIHCGRKFMKNDNLLVHYRTHSRKKPYKCNECKLLFTTNGNLTRHIRLKHRLETQEQNIKKVETYSCKTKECFVLLQDFNKPNKASTSSNTEISSEIELDYSSMSKI